MPASAAPRATRRTALAGGLAGGVVAVATGCEVLDGDAPTTDGSPSPGSTSTGTTGPGADPDTALLEQVRADIAATAAVVEGAGRGRPRVARQLHELDRLHRHHLAELPGDDTGSRRARVTGNDAAATARARAAEGRLQGRLADAAVVAQSGPLASLLASMSAGVAQQLATDRGGAA